MSSHLDLRKLNELKLVAALARRPLLAARLALIRRVSRAVQAMQLAEVCATTWAKESSNRECNQAHANTSRIAAQDAAAGAKSAIDEVLRLCSHGQDHGNGGKSSGDKGDVAVLKFKTLIEEAEDKDPRGISGYAARQALQDS